MGVPYHTPLGSTAGRATAHPCYSRDDAELFTRRFGSVTRDAPLEHAITLMMRAAETGTLADREAATDQVALVLWLNVMMD